MKEELEKARQDVEELYKDLSGVIREVTNEYTSNLDSIFEELSKGINLFSNPQLWDFQVRLSIEAYCLGNIKEQGALKDLCADALYKESLAKSYSATTGAVEMRKQQSILDTLDKQAISMMYKSISSLLKTKCDEAHRMINVIQSIQISRASEAKQNANPRNELDNLTMPLEDLGGNNF